MTIVCVCLTIVISKNWELHQMDVHNVFFHSNLEEEVYMKLPPRFKCSNSNIVCHLQKILVRVKTCTFVLVRKVIHRSQKVRLPAILFKLLSFYSTGKVHLNVLVYIDDLIISGNNSELYVC